MSKDPKKTAQAAGPVVYCGPTIPGVAVQFTTYTNGVPTALEEATKDNDGLHFQIAINYGGRDEIVRASRKMARAVARGELLAEEITEETVSGYLDTAGIPEPDLLIRTCNEQRISNFLLWQLAYTEFYFTPVLWPDFTKEELIKAVEAYNHRDRKYGGLKRS